MTHKVWSEVDFFAWVEKRSRELGDERENSRHRQDNLWFIGGQEAMLDEAIKEFYHCSFDFEDDEGEERGM